MEAGDWAAQEAGFELREGSLFLGYRIQRVIGRGGMGVVYEAVQLSLQRSVALKVIAPDLSRDSSYRARFRREARLAAAFEHPHVLPVHDHGEGPEGQLYLALRLVRGVDLRARLERGGTLSPEEALRLLGPVAEALDAAHAAGLVHRDVKPGNIMLETTTAGHRPYLTDFGLAKRFQADLGETSPGGEATGVGQLVGTPQYMAPEQIFGGSIDGRADVYAFGCLLYRCLVGEPPFKRSDARATLYAHVHEPAPCPSAANPRLPAVFDLVVLRALEKAPERRAHSVGALMRRAAEEVGKPARQRKPTHTAARPAFKTPPPATATTRVLPEVGQGGTGGWRNLATVLALVLTVAAAATAILLVRASQQNGENARDRDVSALSVTTATANLATLTGNAVQQMASSSESTGLGSARPELERSVREARALERRVSTLLPGGDAARKQLIRAQRLDSRAARFLAAVGDAPAEQGNGRRVDTARASYGGTLDALVSVTRLIRRRLSQRGRLDGSAARTLSDLADGLAARKTRLDPGFDAISQRVTALGGG